MPLPGLTGGFDVRRSSTKTTSNTTKTGTFNTTTTPIVPAWAQGPVETAAGRVGGLLGADPNGFVAPANPLQTRAGQDAAGLNDSGWTFEAANGLLARTSALTPQATAPGAQTAFKGASLLDGMDAYASPYRQQVVDAALADFDHDAGRTRAQLDLDLAGAGAFGGSGAALTRSMTEGELARGRATTTATLLDQMFNRAAQLSNLDADRRQEADLAGRAARLSAAQFDATQQAANLDRNLAIARGASDLAEAYGRNQRANIDLQATLGGQLREVDQAQRQAPLTTASQIVAMLNGLPLSLFAGQEQAGTNTENTVGVTKEKRTEGGFKIGFGGGA